MSQNYNITMHQFNGTDYDNLYPATKVEQVDGLATALNAKADTSYVSANFEPKDSTIIKQANVVDNCESTSAVAPLSANMGKALNERIDSLASIGRFLALWNASTGLPTTNPPVSGYAYKSGDYYRVSVLAAEGSSNYKPDGTYYT